MTKILEFGVKVENGPMRSDIGFEGYFRFYKENGQISVEELYFDKMYAKTFYYDDGWISDFVDDARTQYLNDSLEFIDLLLECDPSFKINDHFDDEDEFIISIAGLFIEKEETDGDWETGYYSIQVFIPKIAGFDIIKKEDKTVIYSEGEDCYE